MSDITFDGHAHTITLKDRNGAVIGTWPANNRTASAASLQFVPNATYQVQDSHTPHRHSATQDSVNGEYGSHGIIRFPVPGHDGIGIHSGRQTVPDLTPQRGMGENHVTMGCIRTTDEAMQAITQTMQNDPLRQVQVQQNRNQR